MRSVRRTGAKPGCGRSAGPEQSLDVVGPPGRSKAWAPVSPQDRSRACMPVGLLGKAIEGIGNGPAGRNPAGPFNMTNL